ncbi:MAG: GTPase HflX [Actinomycetota bacterium]|nr:GTPase HflX [Euzebyaceae bacterium]MDQ3453749.1 GTPase HflX [Actinomycetota bacterium]
MADEHPLSGADEGEPELSLSRAQRRRERAQRIEEGAPREGVAIFRPVERAVLVALHRGGQTTHDVDASLDELELLVDTAGAVAAGRVVQRRNVPDVATFIGQGKVAELKALCGSLDADAAIFDDDLSPAQQRTLEERLGVKVLDRTIVILDIFAQHASSREGKAQVELAQLSYLLPRLRGWGASLSRQAGRGIGARRGPGETQLEVDRRKINRRITRLRSDLVQFAATRRLKTKDRERHSVPTVALVGYTNAGKSTLLNRLTGSSVLVADQLFATLDTTARRLPLPDGREVVVTDTVGFVKKLPTQLVEAFKSTLEDTLRANLLLHVVDAAHPEAQAQVVAVDRVLAEIGADAMRRILVLNKADVTDRDTMIGLERQFSGAVPVSAVTGEGTDRLVARIAELLPPARRVVEAVVPYEHAELVAAAHRDGEVLKEEHRPEGTYVVANVGRSTGEALRPYASSDGWLGTR